MSAASENKSSDFGVWDGEVTVDLPDKTDAGVYFLGRIRTPWKERKHCPKNAKESDAVCTIELDPRWAPGLKDVESCSHLVVLYWMDRAIRDGDAELRAQIAPLRAQASEIYNRPPPPPRDYSPRPFKACPMKTVCLVNSSGVQWQCTTNKDYWNDCDG